MSRTVRLINGKGDWEATPPTGATDADLYQLSNDFIPHGGVVDLDGGDALVEEKDTPGFGVKVRKGTIYVPNSSWIQNSTEPKFYQVVGDIDEDIAVSTNSSGDERIDLIAQKIDKVTAPNDDADNVGPLVVIPGTPGAGAPALPNNHELLATLTLPDGYAAVTTAMIEDNRRQVYLETKSFINAGFDELTDGATITIDLIATKKRKFFVDTLGGNRTFVFDNAKEGETIYLKIHNDSSARSPVFSNITWFGIEASPNIADYLDANKWGAFLFVCNNADTQSFDGYFLGATE